MARDHRPDSTPGAPLSDPEPDDDYNLRRPAPHSGMGVTSFIMALLTGTVTVATMIVAAIMGAQKGPLQGRDPAAVTIGLTIIGSGILSLVGAVLGVVGLFQPDRRTFFAILGIVFNLLVVVGICADVALGLAIGRH